MAPRDSMTMLVTTVSVRCGGIEDPSDIVEDASRIRVHVLVIDDDKRAGVAMCKMLEHLGFKVEYVRESSAAIERYKEAERPFDLVILDLMLSGTKATDTLKEIRQYDPNVKAIVCSGYLNDPIMENFQEYDFCAAITKPYQISELKQILSQVLSFSSQ